MSVAMSTQSPTSFDPSPVSRKRSRAGCYICRVRKVKCDGSGVASTSSASRTSISRRECRNCQRLGFECRWQPPAAGEGYQPPPKRRRAAARSEQPVDPTINSIAVTPVPQPSTQDATDSSIDVRGPLDASEAAFGGDSHAPDPGFALGPTFMDFNMDAEGMDFIPLPVIDPSLLPEFAESSHVDPAAYWTLSAGEQNVIYANNHDDDNDHDDDRDDDGDAADVTSPSVNEHNRLLVQHYLDVMKGYSKVDDPSKDANNLFISAFSRSLCFPPLFAAILAFSAAHLSIQDPSYTSQAADLAHAAHTSMKQFRRAHDLEVDGLLSALFIQVKRIQVMGDDVSVFLALISEATDIISTEPGQRALQDPSALTRRIILRLAILDARAACYRLGGGKLVKLLRIIPVLSDIFDGDRTPETVASPGAVASLLRANVFRMQVAELDVRLQGQLRSENIAASRVRRAESTALFSEIENEIKLWEARSTLLGLEPFAAPGNERKPLDSASYSCGAILATLHSALLYLDHIFPLPMFERDNTAARLLRHQLRVHRDPSRRGSPSSISPSSLLLAALLSKDPIHRDWVLKITHEGQGWGRYVTKTRQLLEAIFEAQDRCKEWEIVDIMDQVTGRFVI